MDPIQEIFEGDKKFHLDLLERLAISSIKVLPKAVLKYFKAGDIKSLNIITGNLEANLNDLRVIAQSKIDLKEKGDTS